MARNAESRTAVPLGQLMFDQLCQRIVEGDYVPGTRVSIDAITSEFNVSKQPVMEALRRLESTGLVEIVPQSGCRVREYSRTEAKDFFGVFASIEGDIAAAAAVRHARSDLDALDRALERLHAAESSRNVQERGRDYFIRNAEFHRAIHSMARSPLLTDLGNRMWLLSDFFMYQFAGAERIADAVIDRNHEHDLIRLAVRDHNGPVAKAAMDQHIRSITGLFAATEHPRAGEL